MFKLSTLDITSRVTTRCFSGGDAPDQIAFLPITMANQNNFQGIADFQQDEAI